MLKKVAHVAALSLSLLAATFSTVNAQTQNPHIIVVPTCLLKSIHAPYQTLSATRSLVLISTNSAVIDQLIEAKTKTTSLCGGFIDVTLSWTKNQLHSHPVEPALFLKKYSMKRHAPAEAVNPYKIKHQPEVNALLPKISSKEIWNNLTHLTNFRDRYADSNDGIDAANTIKKQIEAWANENHRFDVTVFYVPTPGHKQPSVVMKMGNSTNPGVVIGGHLDTVKSYGTSTRPGADDDGSGTAAVLEVARTLLSSGMEFTKPIYLIWYAAEEEGLLGSQAVVSTFKQNHIPIDAVLQFDVIGYAHQNEPTLWVVDDYVNKNLTTFLTQLITTYVKQPVAHTECGYACSDHASWTLAGYPASIGCEAAYEDTNPYIHSAQDTMDKLSLNHMTDYAKLATSFAVELAEPVAATLK